MKLFARYTTRILSRRFIVMFKKFFAPVLAALSMLAVVASVTPAAAHKAGVHKLVIHVDDNDKGKMNLALNNAANLDAYYKAKGEELTVEIVAYGPGLHMFREDTSPVKDRIKSFGQNYDNISFRACANTLKKMSKKAPVKLVAEAKMTPSGVVHLMERQEQGWSYIRP